MKTKNLNILLIALTIHVIACSKSSSSAQPPPPPQTGAPASIDPTAVQQTIRGFGGATVFINPLTDADMDALYGTNGSQLGLSILRIRIDPAGQANWGPELGNAQKAIARGAIVMATPWSPPANLKSNNNTIGGELNPSSYDSFARYLNHFATYFAANNAPLYAISVQNEPDISVTYESCNWTPDELFNFVKNNGPTVGSTHLIASESFHFDHAYTDPILNDSAAASHLSIIGGHIYGGGLASYPLAVSKGKEVWMTEHLDTTTDWNSSLNTGKEISDCLATANFNAYIWWYLKRFYGPIDENGSPTKRGFVMAQFARFIRPGYQRINATYNPNTGVYITAYKSGSKIVIVALNLSAVSVIQPFTIGGGSAPTTVTPHITTSTKNLSTETDVTVTAGAFSYTLPAASITTFASN